MNELEELSREAAKVLPEELRCELGIRLDDGGAWRGTDGDGERYYKPLAEHTEACTEIMVRELKGLWARVYALMLHLIEDDGIEEMQAFRTAVLRALIEVKK